MNATVALAILLQAAPAPSPPVEEEPPKRFSSDIEVVARRALTVEDVLARHRLAADSQAARIPAWIASGPTTVAFQAPAVAAPMTVTADATVYAASGLLEIAYADIRLNGAEVPVGRDAVPRLPIIEPERVAATPLALLLDQRYRYRLDDPETVDGHACYVVRFSPAAGGTSLFDGRAWISQEDFGLVRMDAEQTGLRGPIVASRQRDEYRALDVDGERAWVLWRSETRQTYEGPGHRTPIHRVMTLDTFEASPADFAGRRAAAHASSSVLMALTTGGFRYLRRDPAAGRRRRRMPNGRRRRPPSRCRRCARWPGARRGSGRRPRACSSTPTSTTRCPSPAWVISTSTSSAPALN